MTIFLYDTLHSILAFWRGDRLCDEGQIFLVELGVQVVVEVVENNQGPDGVDEGEGHDDHSKEEEGPECPEWSLQERKIDFLSENYYGSHFQSNTEDKDAHIEDDVGVQESVVVCTNPVDLEGSKHQIYEETQSTHGNY